MSTQGASQFCNLARAGGFCLCSRTMHGFGRSSARKNGMYPLHSNRLSRSPPLNALSTTRSNRKQADALSQERSPGRRAHRLILLDTGH